MDTTTVLERPYDALDCTDRYCQNGVTVGLWKDRTPPCRHCEGRGWWPAPDYAAITAALFINRGGKRVFRKSPPNKWGERGDVQAGRTYYVWRMARFHGGRDVMMPVEASFVAMGDPFRDALDRFTDEVAKAAFGTDLAGALRWGRALGHI